MKFGLALAAVCLLTAVCVFGQSIKSSHFRGEVMYSYEIDYETVKDTPSFNPEKEDSPVSMRRALEIARTNLKRFVPKADSKWELSRAELHRIGETKWIYEIEFYCFLKKCPENDSFTIYVKLDGTIVEPEISPNDNKVQPVKVTNNK